MDLLRIAITEMSIPFSALGIAFFAGLYGWLIINRLIRERARRDTIQHEQNLEYQQRQVAIQSRKKYDD